MLIYKVQIFAYNTLLQTGKWIKLQLTGRNAGSQPITINEINILNGGGLTATVTCEESLGELLSVSLETAPLLFLNVNWFVDKMEVTSPEGKVFKFPIYDWIENSKKYNFCEGTALIPSKRQHPVKDISMKELEWRKQTYSWAVYKEGWPKVMNIGESGELPSEVQFTLRKTLQFDITAAMSGLKVQLTKLSNSSTWELHWENFDAIKAMISTTPVSKYVQEHWREDSFFGFQCLNGVNPIMIRKCSSVPKNFDVREDQLKLEDQRKLSEEMKKGNVFLCDYKILEGVETNNINENDKVYLTAPLVLLHLTPNKELKPVAIQLNQNKSSNNPVFYPSDSEWLVAKMFVRSADFTKHQMDTHLLRTHLLAEVFAVSMLRNFSRVHPLFKLLIPHTRFTLQINKLAREKLINEGGIFSKFSAASVKGIDTLIKKGIREVTYDSLCIKEDVKARGVDSLPNYYYKDDGFRLWDIIKRFVDGVISFYYKSDEEVKNDPELQKYIKDISMHGFDSTSRSGIPQSFDKVDELVKFVTMVIFTCSAQHAAVNNGQFDFGSWMPNAPTAIKTPPPRTRGGAVTEPRLMELLPSKKTTLNAVATLTLLSTPPTDFEALGHFPQERFTEKTPCELMERFKTELEGLEEEINCRNSNLPLPYTYLKPSQMENSVSV